MERQMESSAFSKGALYINRSPIAFLILVITAVVMIIVTLVLESESKDFGEQSNLPLPSSLPLVDYEKQLYPWILDRKYAKLGWRHDKQVRDTGPYIDGTYHGTHPAVHIYYSPEMMYWLTQREKGVTELIPDGAIIVKEMFSPPAAIYSELEQQLGKDGYEAKRASLISGYTVMIKDSKASADGWFWASPPNIAPASYPAQCSDPIPSNGAIVEAHLDTFGNNDKEGSYVQQHGLRDSGFGMPCIRCHASAKEELTFSSLRNIEGFLPDEDPLRFTSDGSWRTANTFSNYPLCLLKDENGTLPNAFLAYDLAAQNQNEASAQGNESAITPSEHNRPDQLVTSSQTNTAPYVNQTLVNIFKKESPALKPITDQNNVKKFPQQWLDHVVQKSGTAQEFVTSDNCVGCHGGLAEGTYQSVMFLSTGSGSDGYDLSASGEWRWSPMGLAGRDPIFYAQLESEMALLIQDGHNPDSGLVGVNTNPKKVVADTQHAVTNTCLSCHGSMGQRQLEIDAKTDATLDPNMEVDYLYFTEQLQSSPEYSQREDNYHEYGNLAREGISCMTCHRIEQPANADIDTWITSVDEHHSSWLSTDPNSQLAYTLFHNSTGRFDMTANNQINGPFDVIEKPMEHALNIIPMESDFIKNSQMCGTCHTINLPNIGASIEESHSVLNASESNPAFKAYDHSLEQSTFLEWQNSSFATGSDFQSCQDCHMSGGFETYDGTIKLEQMVTQIAAIEDNQYPDVDEGLPDSDLDVKMRDEYKRHTHVGLNGFLLEMFKQFEPVLGAAPKSYMTDASNPGVDLAIESMKIQARDDTVEVTVSNVEWEGDTLVARVTAQNKVGHRFPSGVAFRRAFLELKVMDGDKVVWASGQTDNAGVITNTAGDPLPTEFFDIEEKACEPYEIDGKFNIAAFNEATAQRNQPHYQPHYQVITEDSQVQIYEELNLDKECNFTTSFVHRVHNVKDNRLLPMGWKSADWFKPQGELMYQFMQATDPENVGNDPDYEDLPGQVFVGQDQLQYRISLPTYAGKTLRVESTLYFQAIPPYWLKQRFDLAPDGEATKRLHYLVSHLDLEETIMEDWKFKITSDTGSVGAE